MVAMLRAAFLGIVLASCTAHVPPPETMRADGDRHGESCAIDADCPGGSCRSGSCSWVAPDPSPGEKCRFDEQCFAGSGSCRAGHCSPWPPERTFIAGPRGR